MKRDLYQYISVSSNILAIVYNFMAVCRQAFVLKREQTSQPSDKINQNLNEKNEVFILNKVCCVL